LVVLVTPHLVKPMAATAARLPSDAYIEPSDFEFYLLGLTEGRPKNSRPQGAAPGPASLPPGFGSQPLE